MPFALIQVDFRQIRFHPITIKGAVTLPKNGGKSTGIFGKIGPGARFALFFPDLP
jgi:hypothetical protein